MEDEKRQEEAMYARLWEEDMLAKAAREERDAKAAHQRNAEVLAVLRKQMAALEAAKEQERNLKEEEAQLLVCCCNLFYLLFFIRDFPTVPVLLQIIFRNLHNPLFLTT